MYSYCSQGEGGVSIVEVAIGLPIFLLFIFFIIALGVYFSAVGSLQTAVGTTRLALTRGQDRLVGSEIISHINAWHAGTGTFSDVSPYVTISVPQDEARDLLNQWVDDTFGSGIVLQDLPAHYTYALVYAAQHMRTTSGQTVRTPCDPDEPGNDGCLACRFIDPYFGHECHFDSSCPQIGDVNYSENILGLTCSFRPAQGFVSPFLRLLSLVTGGGVPPAIVVTRSHRFETG